MRCVEFYAGIGGFAVAAAQLGWRVTLAVDINQHAAAVYRENFSHYHLIRTLESIAPQEIADADFWWMSPPCQPYTRRGRGRDMGDHRTESFLHLMSLVKELRPSHLAVENVPEFANSETARRLRASLSPLGYRWREYVLCPTELGIPNRRRRFYLMASLNELPAANEAVRQPRLLSDYLDASPPQDLFVDLSRYDGAIDRVDPQAVSAVAACFTSAYGKSPVRSGSYLVVGDQLRRFSPREIFRLLGFPESFRLPAGTAARRAYKLIGNSLSVPVVMHLLKQLEAVGRSSR